VRLLGAFELGVMIVTALRVAKNKYPSDIHDRAKSVGKRNLMF
jgi:hypothetical protein